MLPDGFEQLELFPPSEQKKKKKKPRQKKTKLRFTKEEIKYIRSILRVVWRTQESGGTRSEIKSAALGYFKEILGVPEGVAIRLAEPMVNFCFDADPYWLMEWILRELDPRLYGKYKYLEELEEKKWGEKHGSTRSIRDTRTAEANAKEDETKTKTEEKVIQMFVRS